MNKQLDRIFHFVRVCWSWKSNTYVQTERTRALRQNISGQYIHTEREKTVDFMIFSLLEDHGGSGLPPKIILGYGKSSNIWHLWLCLNF